MSSRLPLRRDSATDFSKLSKFNCFRLAVLKYVDVCRCSFRCYWRKDVIPSAARCEREHFLRAGRRLDKRSVAKLFIHDDKAIVEDLAHLGDAGSWLGCLAGVD